MMGHLKSVNILTLMGLPLKGTVQRWIRRKLDSFDKSSLRERRGKFLEKSALRAPHCFRIDD
jgi:hypothetical protein